MFFHRHVSRGHTSDSACCLSTIVRWSRFLTQIVCQEFDQQRHVGHMLDLHGRLCHLRRSSEVPCAYVSRMLSNIWDVGYTSSPVELRGLRHHTPPEADSPCSW